MGSSSILLHRTVGKGESTYYTASSAWVYSKIPEKRSKQGTAFIHLKFYSRNWIGGDDTSVLLIAPWVKPTVANRRENGLWPFFF